jgi:hypothetical protein
MRRSLSPSRSLSATLELYPLLAHDTALRRAAHRRVCGLQRRETQVVVFSDQRVRSPVGQVVEEAFGAEVAIGQPHLSRLHQRADLPSSLLSCACPSSHGTIASIVSRCGSNSTSALPGKGAAVLWRVTYSRC